MSAFYQDFKLGVLGGGQLGRMMIQSAIDFNIDVHVLDPDPNAPCKNIATTFQSGALTDFDTVYEFGKSCDLITIEIENVNTEALLKLQSEGKKVFPQPEVIKLIQNKLHQKQFYKDNGIPTSPFTPTANKDEVMSQKGFLPFVNKLETEGYDGRGVQVISSEQDLGKAFEAPSFVEKLVEFEVEIGVIVARNEKGEIKSYPTVEMAFHPEKNLVEYLFSPATLAQDIEKKAQEIAATIIEKLDMVGLLAVEMFVTKEGEVLVNEVAPRTHNSGHQTIEGNVTSQFEQHLRATLNMPLGDTSTVIPTAMVNLLGEEGHTGQARYEGLDKVLEQDGVHLHLYGKKITKPFRKMGHVTIAHKELNGLKEKVKFVKEHLKIIA
jgi:5-(carboxyamino)imidazole ribonucleotide synthase